MLDTVLSVLEDLDLLVAFVVVAVIMIVSGWLSKTLTKGRLQASAIAIVLGLVLAYFGGLATGGKKGISDIAIFGGMALLGGSMLRDFAIVATAYGIDVRELKRSGLPGALSLMIGVVLSFIVGAAVAVVFGFRDAESIATIGAGAATYIVGPVTGTAVGASETVIALSVAAGMVKSVLVMIGTPFAAKLIGLNNPKSAMIYGGLMGTTSGVAAGLAATDERLVPYGAMTATFYTGMGCLLGPSVLYLATRVIIG